MIIMFDASGGVCHDEYAIHFGSLDSLRGGELVLEIQQASGGCERSAKSVETIGSHTLRMGRCIVFIGGAICELVVNGP